MRLFIHFFENHLQYLADCADESMDSEATLSDCNDHADTEMDSEATVSVEEDDMIISDVSDGEGNNIHEAANGQYWQYFSLSLSLSLSLVNLFLFLK